MLRSVFTDSACFYAFMTMCAAHKAILSGRVIEASDDEETLWIMTDREYTMLKQRSITELKLKLRDPRQRQTNEALETVVTLLTGSVSVPSLSLDLISCPDGRRSSPVFSVKFACTFTA